MRQKQAQYKCLAYLRFDVTMAQIPITVCFILVRVHSRLSEGVSYFIVGALREMTPHLGSHRGHVRRGHRRSAPGRVPPVRATRNGGVNVLAGARDFDLIVHLGEAGSNSARVHGGNGNNGRVGRGVRLDVVRRTGITRRCHDQNVVIEVELLVKV